MVLVSSQRMLENVDEQNTSVRKRRCFILVNLLTKTDRLNAVRQPPNQFFIRLTSEFMTNRLTQSNTTHTVLFFFQNSFCVLRPLYGCLRIGAPFSFSAALVISKFAPPPSVPVSRASTCTRPSSSAG
jgi:hypothetical protein